METIKGYNNGEDFRRTNQYEETQKLHKSSISVDEIDKGGHTPTVGINLEFITRMNSVRWLSEKVRDRNLSVTILGISTIEGPADFQRLLKNLGAGKVSTTAIDISDGIFDGIKETDLDDVRCLQADARDTGLPEASQDINLRDHLGNCCPPVIDREIDQEAARILKPEGVAVVNITTSDLLARSQGRTVIDFDQALGLFGEEITRALQTEIYDLIDLKSKFPMLNTELLRGKILEIEPDGSFVVFGEDEQGHGEWFRRLEDHVLTWENDGFEIVEIQTREGTDGHEPPLECLRHNVILRKI